MSMRYLSICSGIEAVPRAVLQHHYPDVPFMSVGVFDCRLTLNLTPCSARAWRIGHGGKWVLVAVLFGI